jgi:hypothetical protein
MMQGVEFSNIVNGTHTFLPYEKIHILPFGIALAVYLSEKVKKKKPSLSVVATYRHPTR